MSRAIAYLRVSSKAQTADDKDGIERQIGSIKRIAAEKGVDFDTMQIYEDRGISAFVGRNAEIGELKELIDDIENLDIRRGDVIFVESIDRLSRQKLLKTKSLLYDKILSKGVKIITTSDGAIYQDHDDPNEVFKQDLMISLIAQRSWEESRIKSLRRSSAWKKAKSDTSKPFNAHNPPYGIIYNKDKNCFEIDKEKQTELVEIFTLLKNYGIKETLTRAIKNPKYRKWTNKLITNLFDTKYVLGFYKSQKRENGKKIFVEFVENYYPQLISNVMFDQAKSAMTERKTNNLSGYRSEGEINIFRHSIKCQKCGSTMIFEKQINRVGKTFYYYNCQSNREVKGSCVQQRFRFDWLFAVVYKLLSSVSIWKKLLDKSADNELNEENRLDIESQYNLTSDLFLSLVSKDGLRDINNEINDIKEDLSKKQHKYNSLENQLNAFMNDDSDLELNPLIVKLLSQTRNEINTLNHRLDALSLLLIERKEGLNLQSQYDFLELFKTEIGRVKINNHFIKNKISITVETFKSPTKFTAPFDFNDYLKVRFYKSGKFIIDKTMAFKIKKPLLATFMDEEYKDITDIITDIDYECKKI